MAWSPFILLTVVVILWSRPEIKTWLNEVANGIGYYVFEIPGLNNLVIKAAPLVAENTPYGATFTLNIFTAVGTAIIVTALLTMLVLRIKPAQFKKSFVETYNEVKIPTLTIAIVLAFAYVCNYSGLSATLALALSETGKFFVFLSPILGLGFFGYCAMKSFSNSR